jgi:hypothetical protein
MSQLEPYHRKVGRGHLGRCADCKWLLECATVLYNTPIGNWNVEKGRNDCDGFEKETPLDITRGREVVQFT